MSKTPVPITLSAEDNADDLFNNSGEESEGRNPCRGPFVGMPNLRFRLVTNMILCSLLIVLAAFPRPSFISVGGLALMELVPPRQTQTIRTSCTLGWCRVVSGAEVWKQ